MKLVVRAVVADGLDRATVHGLGAQGFFLFVLGLFVNERIAAVFITHVIVRGRLATQVAVDALGIAVIFPCGVVFVFVLFSSHLQSMSAGQAREEPSINQATFVNETILNNLAY